MNNPVAIPVIKPSIKNTTNVTGIPPINGPKYGIILVMKITKANNGKNGKSINPNPIKAIIPIINESINFP